MASPFFILTVLAAVLWDSSYALIVGTVLAGSWLKGTPELPGQRRGSAIGRFQATCLAVLVLCHLVRPWLVASSMSGSTQFGQALALVPTVLSATRQGGLWYANSLALAALVAAQFLIKPRAASLALWIAIAALGVLAATRAASSHASEEGDFSFAEISQFLHLLATSVWAGGILVSAFLVVPHWPSAESASLWNYAHRLSQTVTWALAILILSGIYVAWRDLHGTVSSLWTHPWGKILLAKGSLVALAALLGSLTRFRCVRCPPTSERAAAMGRLLRSEAVVMATILCLSGVLANTDPGR